MEKLKENKFNYYDLSQQEQDQLFDNFTNTYIDSVGSSWSRTMFDGRASGWDFYGTIDGGIAVRPQRSGLLKLNASYGVVDPNGGLSRASFKGIMDGIKELISSNQNTGIWGFMPQEMCTVLCKYSQKNFDDYFKLVPKPLVAALGDKLIKSLGMAGAVQVVKNPLSKDFGALICETPDGTILKKYAIANLSYFDWLKEQVAGENNPLVANLPSPIKKLIAKFTKSDTKALDDIETVSDEESMDADQIDESVVRDFVKSRFSENHDAECTATAYETVEFDYNGHHFKGPVKLEGHGTAICTYYSPATMYRRNGDPGDPEEIEFEDMDFDDFEWDLAEEYECTKRIKKTYPNDYKLEWMRGKTTNYEYLDEDEWSVDGEPFTKSDLWKKICDGDVPDIQEDFFADEKLQQEIFDLAYDKARKSNNFDYEFD